MINLRNFIPFRELSQSLRFRAHVCSRQSVRRGSALVIVLGLLAVLMLMAIAFVVAMRTERGGSSNQRHATVARQMLDTAIARALQDLDEELIGVVTNPVNSRLTLIARPTAPWMIYASTNRMSDSVYAPANILSAEAAAHLPPDQRMAARFAKPAWLPITGDVGRPADDPLNGRYAYVIINNTGYLDANFVHDSDTNRLQGATLGEIRVAADGGKINPFDGAADAKQFGDDRRSKDGKYVSMAEMLGKTEIYPSAPDVNDVNTPDDRRDNSLNVFSYAKESLAPLEPDSIAEASGSGVSTMTPYGKRKSKIMVSSSRLSTSEYATFEKEVREAFTEAFRDSRAGWAQVTSKRGDAQNGINKGPHWNGSEDYSHQDAAVAGLFDYIDEDFLSGRNKVSGRYYYAGDNQNKKIWSNRPCTEPVPMFSDFLAFTDEKSSKVDQADPDTLVVTNTIYSFPVSMRAKTVFLNRIVPKEVENIAFKTEFKVTRVTLGPEPNVSEENAFEGASVEARNSLNNSLATWAAQISGSSTHNPGTTDNVQRYDDINVSVPPLVIEWPANEIAWPDEFTFYLDLEGEISYGNDEVQLVPGQGYRDLNNPLRIGITLNYENLRDNPGVVGWAFVADPRFAYEGHGNPFQTGTGGGMGFFTQTWLTRDRMLYFLSAHDTGGIKLDKELHDWFKEMNSSFPDPGAIFNPYVRFLLRQASAHSFTGEDPNYGLMLTDWSDVLYSDRRGMDHVGGGEDAEAALIMVRNGNMTSVGEMGNLVLAPWRTISLFDGVHPLDDRVVIPRHKVLDWFSVQGSPNKVNLNAPFRVTTRMISGGGTEVISNRERNIDPLTAVFAGLPMNEFGRDDKNRKLIPWDYAANLAYIFYNNILQWDRPATKPNDHLEWNYNMHGMAFDLSVLGRAPPDQNNRERPASDRDGVLDRELARSYKDDNRESDGPRCDFEREAIIRNSVNLLTTRQQIYTIIVRAEAFTPRFGYEDAGQGSTLASAHAIVEVWRDPEPKRYEEAVEPLRIGGNVQRRMVRHVRRAGSGGGVVDMRYDVGVHRWFIRYLNQF